MKFYQQHDKIKLNNVAMNGFKIIRFFLDYETIKIID